jgi:bifunctional NMN adenylyltransferase/nudix hydrolase
MSYPHHFAVFIGRFQPYHNGHHNVIREGLRHAEQVIALCGSAFMPRSLRNPWTFEERKAMILESFGAEDAGRLIVQPLLDSPYNDLLWIQAVQAAVNGVAQARHAAPKIALLGCGKEGTGYYLKMFPQWAAIDAPGIQGINAAAIRDYYFSAREHYANAGEFLEARMPGGVLRFLAESYSQTAFDEVFEEHQFIRNYLAAWDKAPYPPVFMTVDAVVIQSGHVLLIKRRDRPGKGLLALPGGFVDQHETLLDACIRELQEETLLQMSEAVLRGGIKRTEIIDAPYRSARGRTITQATLIELPDSAALPEVQGGDDAAQAFWLPLGDLRSERMFEDHYFIIRHLVGG